MLSSLTLLKIQFALSSEPEFRNSSVRLGSRRQDFHGMWEFIVRVLDQPSSVLWKTELFAWYEMWVFDAFVTLFVTWQLTRSLGRYGALTLRNQFQCHHLLLHSLSELRGPRSVFLVTLYHRPKLTGAFCRSCLAWPNMQTRMRPYCVFTTAVSITQNMLQSLSVYICSIASQRFSIYPYEGATGSRKHPNCWMDRLNYIIHWEPWAYSKMFLYASVPPNAMLTITSL